MCVVKNSRSMLRFCEALYLGQLIYSLSLASFFSPEEEIFSGFVDSVLSSTGCSSASGLDLAFSGLFFGVSWLVFELGRVFKGDVGNGLLFFTGDCA